MLTTSVITSARNQWMNRPADQRFDSLESLLASVENRRANSREYRIDDARQCIAVADSGGIALSGRSSRAILTHWSFGQVAARIGAPAAYLRNLPADLCEKNLNFGLDSLLESDRKAKILTHDSQDGDLRTVAAFTGPDYGRIWDADVVRSVQRIVGDHPQFHPPLDWGKNVAGLYASDRDVYVTMIDGGSIVEESVSLAEARSRRGPLNTGFIVSNSEVGKATLSLEVFSFRAICGNLMFWDVENRKELKIRHSSGAPERFLYEARPAIREACSLPAKPFEDAIRQASEIRIPGTLELKQGKKVANRERVEWLQAKGFTKSEIADAHEHAIREEGDASTVWQLVQGFTAAARDYAYADARIDLSRRASRLLPSVRV